MTNRPKNMGTAHETAVVSWLKDHGWPWARRRTQKGGKDEGDVCLSERIPFTIEAKTSRRTTERVAIGTWMKELEDEVKNSGDVAGAVIFKRRGTTDVGEYHALMPVKYLNVLLNGTFGDAQLGQVADPLQPAKRRRVIPR